MIEVTLLSDSQHSTCPADSATLVLSQGRRGGLVLSSVPLRRPLPGESF
jgi:hypothetical protein